MSPAKPVKKRASGTARSTAKPSAVCRTCGRRIRIPEGWTIGPAVRRHYWAKHRDVMLPPGKERR